MKPRPYRCTLCGETGHSRRTCMERFGRRGEPIFLAATRAYHERHRAAGLCISCPQPLAPGNSTYCEHHRQKHNARVRAERQAGVRR